MSEILVFDKTYEYNTLEPGITVTVKIFSGGNTREIRAKIDTGASYCIFERKHGERLGIDIESGTPLSFGTATGTFRAYGHEVVFEVLEIEFEAIVFFAHEASFTKNVLGQNGFLNLVKLGLIDYEGKLFLHPYNE